MALLEVKNLSVEFLTPVGKRRVVDGIDFSIEKGKILALVGESGSGKSVSALSLARLIPSNCRIASGEVLFEGKDLLKCAPEELRLIRGKRIGYIFQEPSAALNPVLKVGEQIVEAIQSHDDVEDQDAKTKALNFLEQVSIPDPQQLFESYPHELSGGMKQRVAIAIAISQHPDLIIADEPTTALDVTVEAQVIDLLMEIQASLHQSILFITHDLDLAFDIAKEALVMEKGRIVERLSAGALNQASHPYTKKLLNCRLSNRAPKTFLGV